MIDAAVKALAQMLSPPFRTVLLKSVALALALLVLLGIGLHRLLVLLASWGEGWAQSLLGQVAHTPLMVLSWMLTIAAGLGVVAGAIFLMPAVTSLVASFFSDEIALEVERTHYPDEPAGRPLPVTRAVFEGSKTAAAAIGIDLLAVPFLLVAGLGVVIFFVASAFVLGREYFELAAMRHLSPARGQAIACASSAHRAAGRCADCRLRCDPDRQSRHAAVRHGADGPRLQAADRRDGADAGVRNPRTESGGLII